MKNFNITTLSLIGLVVASMIIIPGTVQALDWTYSYDPNNDASGGNLYEAYRLGYAYDNNNLYFNMLTGFPQSGDSDGIEAGDLYINVGGSHNDGTGTVFGLALTSHDGDMNNDADLWWVTTAHDDDAYAWTEVEQGNLYKDAVFSTGLYEGYNGADELSEDGGLDPFGKGNNIPVHIAGFGEDLGFQGNVSWVDNGTEYEVNAIISLADLGLKTGGDFELWWSMECGNELAMMTGDVLPESSAPVPEPGTLLLLGGGLLGLIAMIRKRMM